MILTGLEIEKQVQEKRITISPFDPQHLNPNSYNFHLGDSLVRYLDPVLDPKIEPRTEQIPIPEEGYLLTPDRLVLGSISETIGSDHYVPLIKGRSSIARLGLFINITADLIDQGAIGKWTLQFSTVQPLRIYAGMSIGQMTFWRTQGQPMLYHGKYQGSQEPVASRAWRDFKQD